MLDRYPDAFADVPGSTEHDGAFVGPDNRVYVTGSVVSSIAMMPEVFDRCPIAAISEPWLAHLWQAWRAHEKGGLAAVESEPSAMLMLSLDELSRAVGACERRYHDRLSAKNKRGGTDGQR